MIDPNTETLVSLTEAAKRLPRRRAGRKVHPSCCYRWTTVGCKGVVLESIQVGGTRCTSREALARFFRRLTDPNGLGASRPETSRQHTRRRQREIAAAERALDREGL